jgi:hypothetical protein
MQRKKVYLMDQYTWHSPPIGIDYGLTWSNMITYANVYRKSAGNATCTYYLELEWAFRKDFFFPT